MFTDINSEDRLVQKTFADHLRDNLGWATFYAWNDETFGPTGMLGRDSVGRQLLATTGETELQGILGPNLTST